MIAGLALLLALQGLGNPYADASTAELIARARDRHRALDAAVRDYQATIRTRIDVAVAGGRFAHLLSLAVVEQESEFAWQAPNDLRIVTRGQRARSARRAARVEAIWTRPWFIPRFLGDSIRLLDNDFPNRGAVHPLAPGAEAYYRYAIEDSLEIALPGRTVRAIGVHVTPTRSDAVLIAGQLWLDAETAETVRLVFTFVGRRLWAEPEGDTRRDSARAERANALAMRMLHVAADLEYGLFQERFWLPFRQSLTIDVEFPWFKNLVVPVRFITTFRDVRVDGGSIIAFTIPLPDSAQRPDDPEGGRRRRREAGERAESDRGRREQGYSSAGRWPGGRYEIVVAPDSELRAYAGWTDSLEFSLAPTEAERFEELRRTSFATLERLPAEFSGRRRLVLAVDRFTDIWRYNRAEGVSLGVGSEWRLGWPYASVLGRVRFAFTDRRLQVWAALRRDGPGSRVELAAFREMRDADPLAPGLSFANAMSALWRARDDGDYVFVEGVELRHQSPYRRAADLTLAARVARESAPAALARAGLNDLLGGSGEFPPNGPVVRGTFGTLTAELVGGLRPLDWRAGVEATGGGGLAHVRAWLKGSAGFEVPIGLAVAASGWIGVGAGDSVPQREFRLGGRRTLRGYAAGSFRGPSAYALGVDVGVGRGLITPVAFVDIGETSRRALRFAGSPEASAGVGLSVLGGLFRLQVARPLARAASWRVDFLLGAPR